MANELEEQNNEKIIKSIVRVASARTGSEKPVKKNFKFTLLKLLVGHDDLKQKKIKNAIDNSSKWDKNSIQNIALNSLQDLFFNIIDNFKIKKPFDVSQDYISVKYLESIMNSYYEDKKELENEVEELEEKLEGSGMISKEEHNKEVDDLKEQIKLLKKENNKLEQKLEDREEYYKMKIANADKRALEKLKFLSGSENPRPEVVEDIEGDDI